MSTTIINELLGQHIIRAFETGDQVVLETEERKFRFYHEQDCCESVVVSEVVGDLNSMVGQTVTQAEVTVSDSITTEWGSEIYTYINLATIGGYINICFRGESNGYYSEYVDLEILDAKGNKLHEKFFS